MFFIFIYFFFPGWCLCSVKIFFTCSHGRKSGETAYGFEGYSLSVLPIRIKTSVRERDKMSKLKSKLRVLLYLSFLLFFLSFFHFLFLKAFFFLVNTNLQGTERSLWHCLPYNSPTEFGTRSKCILWYAETQVICWFICSSSPDKMKVIFVRVIAVA